MAATDGERERLFTAIELPREAVDALAALRPPAEPGIRPVGRAQMHVTLHFIGDADTAAVRQALETVAAKRFALTISALGMFARRGRPAALWAGVDHDDRLVALHAAIGAALADAGYVLDERPYRPHVTLARLKPNARRERIRAFLAHAALDPPLRFAVPRFALYASRPTGGGSEYTRRARFALV